MLQTILKCLSHATYPYRAIDSARDFSAILAQKTVLFDYIFRLRTHASEGAKAHSASADNTSVGLTIGLRSCREADF